MRFFVLTFFLLTLLPFFIFWLLPFFVIVYGKSTSCHSTYSMVSPFCVLICLIFCIISWNSSSLVLSGMHYDASFSTFANLSSFKSGFKYFTHKQVSQVKGLGLWMFCGMFLVKEEKEDDNEDSAQNFRYKVFKVDMRYLTRMFSLFLVTTVFNPGLTRGTSSLSMNSLIAFIKDVSASVKYLEFDKLTLSSFLNNVFSPFDIESLKKRLLFIFVCGDKPLQRALLTNSFCFFLSGVE